VISKDLLCHGGGILLNDGRNVRREFSTGMTPKDFKPPYDARIGMGVPQLVKTLFIFVGVTCSYTQAG
jgi:hypothetical protein